MAQRKRVISKNPKVGMWNSRSKPSTAKAMTNHYCNNTKIKIKTIFSYSNPNFLYYKQKTKHENSKSIKIIQNYLKRGGAGEACWAHNPKVGGSKPPLAKAMTNHHCKQYKNKNQTGWRRGSVLGP
jgi:hypothetical protein